MILGSQRKKFGKQKMDKKTFLSLSHNVFHTHTKKLNNNKEGLENVAKGKKCL